MSILNKGVLFLNQSSPRPQFEARESAMADMSGSASVGRSFGDSLPCLLFGGRRREKASASGILFGGSTRGRETEQLLNVLSNRHGAEDVEEDEGTVCHVIARQIPVREALRGNKGEAW